VTRLAVLLTAFLLLSLLDFLRVFEFSFRTGF
jgi:hypothetical protein